MDGRPHPGPGNGDSGISSLDDRQESRGQVLAGELAPVAASGAWAPGLDADDGARTARVETGVPPRKRAFDLAFCLLSMPLWLPLTLVGMLGVLCGAGFPALYVSPRIVYRGHIARIAKLRTMVPGAAAIANRATVPMDGQRFLNIGTESPLYTPVGRLLEKLSLTELPQFVHVLTGTMSVIGNRPLPHDVLSALAEVHPEAGDRFLTRAGLTGPVQLVGRENISDADRLAVEIAYCRLCLRRYSIYLDFMIALQTVLILSRIRPPFTVAQIGSQMEKWARTRRA